MEKQIQNHSDFYHKLIFFLFISMMALIPITKFLPTLFGGLLFLLCVAYFRPARLDRDVRNLVWLSIFFFGVLWLLDIVAGPPPVTMRNITSMTQFFYLPIVFAVLTTMGIYFTIEKIAKYTFYLLVVVFALAILESIFIKDHIYWAPFGTVGRMRYIFIGFANWPRVALLVGNSLTFADMTIPMVFMSFVGFWRMSAAHKIGRAFVWAMGLFVFIALTQNRGSIINYFALSGILVLYLIITTVPKYRLRVLWVSFVIVMIVAILAGVIFAITDTTVEQRLVRMFMVFAEISQGGAIETVTDVALRIRLDFWQGAIKAIQQSPWIGNGVTDMMDVIRPHLVSQVAWEATYLKTPHSLILNTLVAGGVVSLVLLFSVLLYPVYAAIKFTRKNYDIGVHWLYLACIVFFGIFVAGLTNNIFYDDHKNTAFISYMFLVTIGIAQARKSSGNLN